MRTLISALGNAVVGVAVYDDHVAMNSDECRVPECAAGERDRQLRVETAQHFTRSPASPHVRVDDHQNHEQQRAQVVDTQADNEDLKNRLVSVQTGIQTFQ